MMYVSDWTLKYDEPEVENDTRSTVTRWSFDNDKPHVTAFRPISETANSWSYDSKQWRHSWSTTPTQIPALWLAATSCATSQKNEHVYFWLQSHRSCITVALWTTLNCPRCISLPPSSSRIAGEGRRVVAPPCPRSTARRKRSPVGTVDVKE